MAEFDSSQLRKPTVSLGAEDARLKHYQGPPPEAIQACKGKQLGAEVGCTGRRGETLEARCQEIKGILVAVPTPMPEGGPRP